MTTTKHKTYSIFGAGAAGLYTAWRLLNGETGTESGRKKQLVRGDVLELFDWGNYDFTGEQTDIREAGARVCTWHYKNDPDSSYLEVGGMRYSRWDTSAPNANDGAAPGHRLVTTVISKTGLDPYVVPFNESSNPLYYLRSKNFYQNDITSQNPAPYNTVAATAPPSNEFGVLQNLAPTTEQRQFTRQEWNDFYQHGRIEVELPVSSVFQKGDHLKDIGYWNLMYDQLGSEGYSYAADGNGYSSNVINWNSADALQANNEFTPGTNYFTITTGYSGMFVALFKAIVALADQKGIEFRFTPNTRLQSIFVREGTIHYRLATRAEPWRVAESCTTQAAWLAMPRHAIELVAQGSRYTGSDEVLDVLNAQKVRLYLEAAVMQPSYKVGMFFDSPWWLSSTTPYPAQIVGFEVTQAVIDQLKAGGFPGALCAALCSFSVLEVQFSASADLVRAVEQQAGVRMTVKEEQQLTSAAERNTIGPSISDTPIRMVVYFGNNARASDKKPVYGVLASYDDEAFTTFWQELEIGPNRKREQPRSEDIQTLDGPREVPPRMVKMLRRQLAELHFGPNADYSSVPEPIEARYMDWSLPPFAAGYHAWAAHYDIADVQEKIRKPSQLTEGADADIFIVGEAYSNDQAWVEGAYCTAESVLNDFFEIKPIIDNEHYPFICRTKK